MVACECIDVHKRRRVVLTGGPGAGKTALLELTTRIPCGQSQPAPRPTLTPNVVSSTPFPRFATIGQSQ